MPENAQQNTAGGRFFGFTALAWRRASREGLYVLLGQVGVAVIGLGGLRLVTHFADRSVFGEATLLLGTIALGRNIFVAPITNTQFRYHSEFQESGDIAGFTYAISKLSWIGTLLFGGVGALAYFLWTYWAKAIPSAGMFVALGLCLAAENVRTIPVNWLSAERKQGRVAAWQVVDQAMSLLCSVLGLVIASHYGRGASALYIAGQSIGTILVAQLFSRLWFPRRSRRSLSAEAGVEDRVRGLARSYGTPFVALAVVSWLLVLGDRYILGGVMSTDAVGGYVASYAIASRAVAMPQGVLATFARTVLFQAVGKGDAARADKVFRLWLLASIATGAAVTVALWLCGAWISELVLDERYRSGAPQLMLGIGAGHALFGVTQAFENRLMSYGVSKSLIVPALLGGVANIVCCFLLVPALGSSGAALAKICAFGTNCIAVWIALIVVSRTVKTS